MNSNGKFITIDGIDGSGKTSLSNFIAYYLSSIGKKTLLTREPGGTSLGDKIRSIVLSESILPKTELLLMYAMRNEHINKLIIPSIKQGIWVISDRYSDASYSYQSGGRLINSLYIDRLEEDYCKQCKVDLTLLIDIDINVSMSRLRFNKDRFESESFEFFDRVRKVYMDRAKLYPDRIVVLDGSLKEEDIREQAISAINSRIML